MSPRTLSIANHTRDAAGLRYVYPVLSRRAGGISVGINLNPNRACNWRCIYCQVPGLQRGAAPVIDVGRLARELAAMLDRVAAGEFVAAGDAPGRLADIAISGDGEPTTAREFAQVIGVIEGELSRRGLLGPLPVRLITNGSMLGRRTVRAGIAHLASIGGEVWFKLDGGSAEAFRRINSTRQDPQAVARRLAQCAALCPTWVQTCVFRIDGSAPGAQALDDYCRLLRAAGIGALRGVLLYGIARASMQPEAARLEALSEAEMESIAQRLRASGLTVKVSP